MEDKTIVVFTSDNGGVSAGDAKSTSNLPLRGGKGRQWEGGIREPYYIQGAGRTHPGSVCEVPVSGIDFYPTLARTGRRSVARRASTSTVSAWCRCCKGGDCRTRSLLALSHYGNQGGEPSSIIRRSWKLIHYYEDHRDELYNLDQDVGEQTNRGEAYPAIIAELTAKLEAWLQETEALIPEQDDRFDAARKRQQIELQQTERLHA